MMKKLASTLSLFLLLFVPYVAQAVETPRTFKAFVNLFADVLNAVIYFIVAISFLVFLWGIFQYFFFPQSEDRKTKGKQVMLWGLITFFVMFSVWGIVFLIRNTLFF